VSGFLYNNVEASSVFIFPLHGELDNWRFSPTALRLLHEKSGFTWIEGDFHVNFSSVDGVGDTNPKNYLAPQAIMGCYALCQKPK